MDNEEIGIPLVGRAESPELQLLVAKPACTADRRIEDWIASNLDTESVAAGPNLWNKLIENLPGLRRVSRRPGREGSGGGVASQGGWSRFNVAYRRGITMVRLVDNALVQRSHIQELGCDLMDLIEVGNHRVVLNFTVVERLGSWIIGVVGNAHRRCAAADGGKLKICGLDPQLAEIFSIVGMAREIDLQPDEAAAIDGPWPRSVAPRQLPVDILGEVLASGAIPLIRGGSPAEDSAEVECPPRGRDASATQRSRPVSQLPATISLRVQVGSSEGRTVTISTPRFLIGRDRGCQLRLGSAQVSKQHAAIERRDGKVYLHDLGSTNGTLINGRHIRDMEFELHHDDQIQIGPVLAKVVLGAAPAPLAIDESPVEELAEVEALLCSCSEVQADPVTTEELPFIDDTDPASRIKHEVIEDILVVTPRLPELEDEGTLEALRSRLQALFEEPLPRRVVVNLEFVNHLSRRAIAVLLAHHFRLEWSGGSLRICQAHARIIALLDQVRLTMLVDCYPTLDEAVLATWSGALKPAHAQQ